MASNGVSGLDMEKKSGGGGGVEDIYGEDSATEDQLVTPWTVSVARWATDDKCFRNCLLLLLF